MIIWRLSFLEFPYVNFFAPQATISYRRTLTMQENTSLERRKKQRNGKVDCFHSFDLIMRLSWRINSHSKRSFFHWNFKIYIYLVLEILWEKIIILINRFQSFMQRILFFNLFLESGTYNSAVNSSSVYKLFIFVKISQ